jgi:hypothetical protein
MTTEKPITREDFDPDPKIAYRQITAQMEVYARALRAYTPMCDQLRREIAGSDHGGVAALAEEMKVSHPRAGKALVEGLVRAVRAAAEEIGFTKDDLKILSSSQAHPAKVEIYLPRLEDEATAPAPDIDPDVDPVAWEEYKDAERAKWIDRMNVAGALIDGLRRAGLGVDVTDEDEEGEDKSVREVLADGGRAEVAWIR